MKKTRKMVAILVCLIMVASMAAVASAAVSMPLFIEKSGGYKCHGYGDIVQNVGSAVFRAEVIPMEPIIPGVDCESVLRVETYDTAGKYMGETVNEGDVNATASHRAPRTIGRIECSFEFNGADLGEYTLYAK